MPETVGYIYLIVCILDIDYKNKRIQKNIEAAFKAASKRYKKIHSKERAEIIRARLREFESATTLEDLRKVKSARCHELKSGKGVYRLSVDLDHPYRLIFAPVAPVPTKKNGGLDWSRVTRIMILKKPEDNHNG